MIRQLVPADRPVLDDFLAAHATSSMFLRSNLRQVGLAWGGRPYEGQWFGAFEGDRLVGVTLHAWNGSLLLQAPEQAVDLARAARAGTGRRVTLLIGPWEQVDAVRGALFPTEPTQLASREVLYRLPLDALRVPEPLARGEITVRSAEDRDEDLLSAWRLAYAIETIGVTPGAGPAEETRRQVRTATVERRMFVAAEQATPLGCSTFNARLPDIVQIGGVYTPPDRRSRGVARCVVAGSLLRAREEGVQDAILFTGEENHPARRSYEALGFTATGHVGLVIFA